MSHDGMLSTIFSTEKQRGAARRIIAWRGTRHRFCLDAQVRAYNESFRRCTEECALTDGNCEARAIGSLSIRGLSSTRAGCSKRAPRNTIRRAATAFSSRPASISLRIPVTSSRQRVSASSFMVISIAAGDWALNGRRLTLGIDSPRCL